MAHIGHVSRNSHRLDLPACLRKLFRASFWKIARQDFKSFEVGRTKWSLPLCWWAGLFMALEPSHSMQERFDCALASREEVAPIDGRGRCNQLVDTAAQRNLNASVDRKDGVVAHQPLVRWDTQQQIVSTFGEGCRPWASMPDMPAGKSLIGRVPFRA